jgi:hypothetical protein
VRPVLAIGHNYLRQSWYVLASFAAYVFLLAFFNHHGTGDDTAAIVSMESFFLVSIGGFLGVTGLTNDIRSRRIIFVLAKAVSRVQYLAGMGYGALILIAAMDMAALASWRWMGARHDAFALAALLLAFLMHAAGMLGAVLLDSRFALIVPALLFGLPWLTPKPQIVPHTALTLAIANATSPPSWGLAATVVETALVFLIAAIVFERKDVTVAGE